MLATILKSPEAVRATLSIVETFARIRELTRNIKTLSQTKDEAKQGDLMRKSGNFISEILDDDLQTTDTETTIEINFAVLKLKHPVSSFGSKS